MKPRESLFRYYLENLGEGRIVWKSCGRFSYQRNDDEPASHPDNCRPTTGNLRVSRKISNNDTLRYASFEPT